jgi:hypothetical protein
MLRTKTAVRPMQTRHGRMFHDVVIEKGLKGIWVCCYMGELFLVLACVVRYGGEFSHYSSGNYIFLSFSVGVVPSNNYWKSRLLPQAYLGLT